MSNGSGNGAHRPGEDDPLRELREVVESFRKRFGGGSGSLSPWPFLAIGLVLYFASGIFIVGPDERGIVLRFGKAVREVGPGPSYHLPWPIEEVLKPSVTQIRKEEFGFRTVDVGPPARYRAVEPEGESLVKGLENLIADLEAVTPADVARVAQRLIHDERLHLAVVGPFDSAEPFEQALRL